MSDLAPEPVTTVGQLLDVLSGFKRSDRIEISSELSYAPIEVAVQKADGTRELIMNRWDGLVIPVKIHRVIANKTPYFVINGVWSLDEERLKEMNDGNTQSD